MANKILKNPFEIKLAVSKPAEKIEQSAYVCYETQKMPILKKIFKENPPHRVIIFSSSKLKVKQLAREMRKQNLKIAEMHSDLDQTQRDNVMLDFKSGKTNVIVATDILSRGIDIDDIEMVVNYDVPHEAEDYVHRIGRTARADRDGKAVTFVTPEDMFRLRKIERLLEKEVPKAEVDKEFGDTPAYNKDVSGRKKSGRRSGGKAGGKRKSSGKADARPEVSDSQSKEEKPKRRRHRGGAHRKAGSSSNAKSSTSSAESTK